LNDIINVILQELHLLPPVNAPVNLRDGAGGRTEGIGMDTLSQTTAAMSAAVITGAGEMEVRQVALPEPSKARCAYGWKVAASALRT